MGSLHITSNFSRLSVEDFDGLRASQEEAIALARALGDENNPAAPLHASALLAYLQFDWETSNWFLGESTPLACRLSSPWECSPLCGIARTWCASMAA